MLALDEAVRHLRTLGGRPLELLKGDITMQWAVLHGLQMSAQNCLDIATHIAASAGVDVAEYRDAIGALAKLGVLPPEFASRFAAVAGFRNLLVHGYIGVDLSRVHRLLETGLDDFAEFARHVEALLARR
ncbi:MAG: DUF86 domain-containing protein [Myxococcales bacterium]|nr:DUF86 domain-containing protein [Myxococcales bacterium]